MQHISWHHAGKGHKLCQIKMINIQEKQWKHIYSSWKSYIQFLKIQGNTWDPRPAMGKICGLSHVISIYLHVDIPSFQHAADPAPNGWKHCAKEKSLNLAQTLHFLISSGNINIYPLPGTHVLTAWPYLYTCTWNTPPENKESLCKSCGSQIIRNYKNSNHPNHRKLEKRMWFWCDVLFLMAELLPLHGQINGSDFRSHKTPKAGAALGRHNRFFLCWSALVSNLKQVNMNTLKMDGIW